MQNNNEKDLSSIIMGLKVKGKRGTNDLGKWGAKSPS